MKPQILFTILSKAKSKEEFISLLRKLRRPIQNKNNKK